MAITRVFDISQRALQDSKRAIDTISKNIANVNTEGYKRRSVDTENRTGMRTANGADIQALMRSRNVFIENQLIREQGGLGKYESDASILTNIESIFGEPGQSGLQNLMSEFWNSWNDLANDPESQSARIVVRDKAIMMTNTFNRIYSDLHSMQQEMSSEIGNTVTQVNKLINQIDTLNQQYTISKSADILDQRDLILNKLSKLIDIEIKNNSGSNLVVSLDGKILVSDDYVGQIVTDINYENGFPSYTFTLDTSQKAIDIEGGSLGSILDINNSYIPNYMYKLDTMASSLANRVNQVHRNGYNLDGETGINFFTANINGAADIAVNSEIIEDSSLIASAGSSSSAGDGSIAQAVYDVQFEKVLENGTLSDYYNSLITQVGHQVSEAEFLSESQKHIVESLQNQQDSVSGVSLDEELAKLIEFQNAFQAASRLVSAADEMIKSILNMI